MSEYGHRRGRACATESGPASKGSGAVSPLKRAVAGMTYVQQRAYLDPDSGALTFGRPVQANGALAGFASTGRGEAVQMQEEFAKEGLAEPESDDATESACASDEADGQPGGLTVHERMSLHSHLVGRLSNAYTNFVNGTEHAEETLTSRVRSGGDLAIVIVSLALDLVAPKLVSQAIQRVISQSVPQHAAQRVYRAALFAMDRADVLTKQINRLAASTLRSEVMSELADPRRAFLAVLRQAFDRSTAELSNHVRAYASRPAALPDEELLLYVAKWEEGATTEEYHSLILDLVEDYMSQVFIIGQFGDMAELAYWVRSPTGRRDLAILDGVGPYQHFGENPEGRFREYRFRAWVRPEFQNTASHRMRQLCGCNPPIVEAGVVRGLADVPEWEETQGLPPGLRLGRVADAGANE